MAVRIRLTRVGATKRPAYRVIAIDKHRSRDGRALEILGFYDPLTEPATVQLETAKIQAWIGKGAQPSDTVVRLMRQAERDAASAAAGPAKPTRAAPRARPSKKAQASDASAAPPADPAPDEPAATAEDTATATPAQDATASTADAERADA